MIDRIHLLQMIVFLAVGCLLTSHAAAQTWNYWLHNSYTGERTPSYLTVEDKGGGKAVLRQVGGRLSACVRQPLDATLTKTEADTIISVVPTLPSRDEFRLVIKNDGTGGQRQVKQGGEWVSDGQDRGLTLRK